MRVCVLKLLGFFQQNSTHISQSHAHFTIDTNRINSNCLERNRSLSNFLPHPSSLSLSISFIVMHNLWFQCNCITRCVCSRQLPRILLHELWIYIIINIYIDIYRSTHTWASFVIPQWSLCYLLLTILAAAVIIIIVDYFLLMRLQCSGKRNCMNQH